MTCTCGMWSRGHVKDWLLQLRLARFILYTLASKLPLMELVACCNTSPCSPRAGRTPVPGANCCECYLSRNLTQSLVTAVQLLACSTVVPTVLVTLVLDVVIPAPHLDTVALSRQGTDVHVYLRRASPCMDTHVIMRECVSKFLSVSNLSSSWDMRWTWLHPRCRPLMLHDYSFHGRDANIR
jgi:hypothetical protein